jgi:Flp pilus assembly protein protease CpaA
MSKKLIAGLTVAAVIGIGTYAFGHMGGGDGTRGITVSRAMITGQI